MGLTYKVASQLGGSLLEMWHHPLAHAAPWSRVGEKADAVTPGTRPLSPALPLLPLTPG